MSNTHARPEPRTSKTSLYIDVPSAAAYMGTGERFVRRLVAERRVPFHKVGRHVRLRTADLDAFLAAGRVEPGRGPGDAA